MSLKNIFKASLLMLSLSFSVAAHSNNRFNVNDMKAQMWADSVMATLSDDEKIGQLFIFTTKAQDTPALRTALMKQIKENKVGGLLFWKGNCEGQAALTNLAQSTAKVPLLITLDGEWGLRMRLDNTLRYPRKLTLSALNNDSLIYDWGVELGRQCKALGIHVNFDPVLDVNLNPDNPVINVRSFGDDAKDIARKASIFVRGMHQYGIACVGKHFPGHGDTQQDSHKELALVTHDRATLDSVDLLPYRRLQEEHLLDGVMVGHISVPVLDKSGMPASLSKTIVTDFLRGEMGYNGLIMTDAMKMGAVAKRKNYCVEALVAGNDMILDAGEGNATGTAIASVKKAVADGVLTMDDIEQKCRKVLIYKYLCGAHEYKPVDPERIASVLNSESAKSLQQRIARGCVTVLKNSGRAIPMASLDKNIVLVTLGSKGETYFASRVALHGSVTRYNIMAGDCAKGVPCVVDSVVKNADVAIFSIHDDQVPDSVLARLTKDAKGRTVHAYFISPYLMSKYKESALLADATVVGYESAQCMQYASADVIFGANYADAHLPVPVQNVCDKGRSVRTSKNRLGYARPEDVGMSSERLALIDSIVVAAIDGHATPSCQVLVARHGMIVYDKAFGHPGYESSAVVSTSDIYDLASCTKLMATLPAVMKLYDQGKINLDRHVSHYLPEMKRLHHVTVRDLLMHQSGLPASKPFYMSTVKRNDPSVPLFGKRDANHTARVDVATYADADFKFVPELVCDSLDSLHTLPIAEGLYLNPSFKDSVTAAIAHIKPGERKYVYSDINFMLLQRIVEKVSGMSLDSFVMDNFYRPAGAVTTGYLPLKRFCKSRIMPTANDPFLRKQHLRGYVHDENAAFQGGVSGHAGLFSNAEDLAKLCQIWLNDGTYGGHTYFSKETDSIFVNAKSEISRRGLGFDRQKIEESANREHVMIGHTGFTGTCVWIDPEYDLTYIFLSNRVNPEAWNKKLVKTNVRTDIASVIYQSVTDR